MKGNMKTNFGNALILPFVIFNTISITQNF
jgi:hypothetical protein